MRRFFLSVLVGCAVAAAADLNAADADKKAPANDRQQTSQPPKKSGQPDDLDACKQQAHGLHGRERSRFMTKCLKENG